MVGNDIIKIQQTRGEVHDTTKRVGERGEGRGETPVSRVVICLLLH